VALEGVAPVLRDQAVKELPAKDLREERLPSSSLTGAAGAARELLQQVEMEA
jgi:hypothetical protein